MLRKVDRIQLVVRDRSAPARARELFGAEEVGGNNVPILGARRIVMQAGASLFEFLEPAGAGPVADHLARFGEGLFAVGFAVDDLASAAKALETAGVGFREERAQLYPDPSALLGMRTVLSFRHERAPVGRAIRAIYEGTFLVADHAAAAEHYAQVFGLDRERFVPIGIDEFGYTGQLLMFDAPARLDRIELAMITNPDKAMGRFYNRRGNSWYMFYAETDDPGAFAERLQARGVRFSEHQGLSTIYLHPSAFCGALAGVSRTGAAWRWSGDPARGGRPDR
jgi:extradiol dioxygenase family protein